MNIIILQRIFLEAFIDFLYAPLWWYSKGIVYIVHHCEQAIKSGNEELAPGVWLKNIFVPMFGSYDWQGRIISFFMRLVQIVVRGFLLILWIFIVFIIGVLWLLLPIITLYGIAKSFF